RLRPSLDKGKQSSIIQPLPDEAPTAERPQTSADGKLPAVAALPHLRQASLRDRVAQLLEQRILDGTFAAGGRIPPEHELVQRLGVSRTVVRDALRVLEARGLVEVRRGSGTRVRSSTTDAYAGAAPLLLIPSQLTLGH